MSAALIVWRVVGWDARFETRGTLRKRGPRAEIVVSTDLHGGEQQKLLDASGGFIAFALWNLICRIAATSSRRGVLLQDGRPLDEADLARLARFPLNLIGPALDVLVSPDIGLLERAPLDQALVPAEIPAPLPRKPRIKSLLECPVCSADLTEYYQLQVAPAPQVPEPVASPSVPEAAEPVAESAVEPVSDLKPRPTWERPAHLIKTTREEIRYIAQCVVRGQMTQEQLREWVDTHYRDKSEDQEVEDEEVDEEDWDEELEQDFQTGLPPPKQGKWG